MDYLWALGLFWKGHKVNDILIFLRIWKNQKSMYDLLWKLNEEVYVRFNL
jgi:hypothetical protein